MGGFFGTIKKTSCVTDLFYGIDYNSHMGTKRAGMATLNDGVYTRAIHNIANSYFRTKFEPELPTFAGYSGIGVISDTDAQPIIVNCHLGKFAIVTVAKITNLPTLERELLAKGNHFCEHSNGITNQSELVSMLIAEGKTFTEGIENVFRQIKGSCSMLILTESGIIAARDKYGRTPIVIGKGSDGYAISSESCAFPNLGYETDYFIGPGEIVLVTRRLLHLRHAAQQPGSDRTQHPGGTRRTEDVSHRIANRHRAEIGFRSARQLANRIGRHAQHGRHRLRPGQQPRSLRKRIAHQPGEEPYRPQTQQTDHHGEGHLRQSVLLQPPEELRADRIPHGEKKHQEEKGFGRFGNLDTKLPDDYAHQQHAGYRSERKAADAQLTQQKPQRNGQKDGQRRVRLDEVRELYTCKHNLSGFTSSYRFYSDSNGKPCAANAQTKNQRDK